MYSCLGGSEKGTTWHWAGGLGGAPNFKLFSQIPFRSPPSPLHLLCSHHPGRLAAVTAGAPVPAPEDVLWAARLQFPRSMQSTLCLSSARPHLRAPLSLFQTPGSSLHSHSGSGHERKLWRGRPLLPILQHQAQPNRPGRMDGSGRSTLSPICQVTHQLNQISLCS